MLLLNPACSGIFYFTPMREELLHYIWKFKKFRLHGLKTIRGLSIQLLDVGAYNRHSGPDFLNARLEIDKQLWAGNIELHVKSSHWYVHKHHRDKSFQNIVLHVVWEADRLVYRDNGEEIPTLVLREYVNVSLLDSYRKLLTKTNKKFINCEEHTREFSIFLVLPWLEHLFRERLDQKCKEADQIFRASNKNWEKLLFIQLLKNFGQRANRSSFLSLARAVDYNVVRKIGQNTFQLECLLFGLSGILAKNRARDHYHQSLTEEYAYLVKKYKLSEVQVEIPEFMGIRPSNFPTIRLSQFAVLYSHNQNLFGKLLVAQNKNELYDLLNIKATAYWHTHYNFGKKSKEKNKILSKAFIDILIINAVLPIKYLFAKERGEDIYPQLRNLVSEISKENNSLVQRYQFIGFPVHHAIDSQALIQLYHSYCVKNRCLECALGNQILN